METTFPRILATTALCLAAMGLGLMFSLRGVSPELGVSGFTLAFLTFFPTIYTLFSEGANMPECRRRAIEAALPAFKLNTCRNYILRPVSCLAYYCGYSSLYRCYPYRLVGRCNIRAFS